MSFLNSRRVIRSDLQQTKKKKVFYWNWGNSSKLKPEDWVNSVKPKELHFWKMFKIFERNNAVGNLYELIDRICSLNAFNNTLCFSLTCFKMLFGNCFTGCRTFWFTVTRVKPKRQTTCLSALCPWCWTSSGVWRSELQRGSPHRSWNKGWVSFPHKNSSPLASYGTWSHENTCAFVRKVWFYLSYVYLRFHTHTKVQYWRIYCDKM